MEAPHDNGRFPASGQAQSETQTTRQEESTDWLSDCTGITAHDIDPYPRNSILASASSNTETAHDPLSEQSSTENGIDQKEYTEIYVTALDDNPIPNPHSVFSEPAKVLLLLYSSFVGMLSPMSSSIYLPALSSLSRDLDVSVSKINMTITTYMICQALAPAAIGSFADAKGRRPAYLICLVITILANVGLAVQGNYTALMVLRGLQSCGSSGTISLAFATIADLGTRAERGKYLKYAAPGLLLGPALGPIVGGLLDHYRGWRSIFYFLALLATLFLVLLLVVVPETCRAVVGNGSVPPQKWNRSLWQYCRLGGEKHRVSDADSQDVRSLRVRLDILGSWRLVLEKETAMINCYTGLLYAGYIAIMSTLATQMQARHGFDSRKIGLCYLPLGVGSLLSHVTVGRMLDKNFCRIARIHGIPIIKNQQQNVSEFPIEIARLQLAIPYAVMGTISYLAYSWVLNFQTGLAAVLVALFFVGYLVTGSITSLYALVEDQHPQMPATAGAALNLVRCLLGAGAVAAAIPLINRIGMGCAGTVVICLWIFFSPTLWIVLKYGPSWRAEEDRKAKEKAEKRVMEEMTVLASKIRLEAMRMRKS